ncbi:GNAT family N-acetyltransferase [Kineococcus sp. GCM10028916]|uniref:GNAT family N-acetyltransferase n=1 Tax=Kineococcus sp. GCM10028916 TaxID=3273394 RepID=UPI0036422735
MTGLTLRPMTLAEFDAWQDETIRAYADEQVTAGTWSAAEALERSRRTNAELLPRGSDTPRMLFLRAVVAGTPVGRVWIGLDHPRGTADCAYLFDIEVLDEHRGRGLGRELLRAAEEVVRQRGAAALELNVFGANTRAVHLYRSAGYTVTTQQMRRILT